jgi:hypothetical protein
MKIKKNLNSDSLIQHSDSPTRRVREFLEKYSDSDSPTRQVGELSTPRLSESVSHVLPNSTSRRVGDSPTHRVRDLIIVVIFPLMQFFRLSISSLSVSVQYIIKIKNMFRFIDYVNVCSILKCFLILK